MEKNIKNKIQVHDNDFKDNLKQWFHKNNASIVYDDVDHTNDFIQYLIDFPALELSQQDFKKRKRIKNCVPDYNRCIAMKCNGERCSRKQKGNGIQFCGTHMKGAPHGTFSNFKESEKQKQINLWLQEINGISRYIDDNHNIYSTEDIINQAKPPKIIGKYGIKPDNVTYYMIQD